ncbi:MAG: sigma-70 family RNA polymerase sigma factor [Acidobacteriia bacterium]|nr:sigma-70 family RNA polymerase sigma factor [Terriglobia bacterium]
MLTASNEVEGRASPSDPASGPRNAEPSTEGAGPSPSPDQGAQWRDLVARIQSGEDAGMEELYRLFSKGIRFYLCRQLGPQELDDKVHDTFLIVVQAIQRGDLREPERLMGFVRTVVRRQVAAFIDHAVQNRRDQMDIETSKTIADNRQNPEQTAIIDEKVEIMREVLRAISTRDREILTRFYIQEQSQEEICSEMGLSETQFRLLKSRAKARFGELGRKKMTRKSLNKLSMRNGAGC